MNLTSRSTRAIAATSSLCTALAVSVAAAPRASADPSCSTPAVVGSEVTITCTYDSGGFTDITVPEGAETVSVRLDGAGGGGGGYSSRNTANGAAGGAGARVEVRLDAQDLSAVRVVLGGGGSGGTDGGTNGFGGGGGGHSAVFRGASTDAADYLVIAGGGGGGGGGPFGDVGGAGGVSPTGAGGAGGGVDGGSGGGSGSGGAGGAGGSNGSDWTAGGSGGNGEVGEAGDGGDGYGGGGGGGFNTDRGGGGAGGSDANPSYLLSAAIFSAAGGAGGAGGTDVTLNGGAGDNGSVTFTFTIRVIPSPTSTSSSATPPEITLEFTLPAGTRCDFGSVEASQGAWIQLPGAQDCTVSPRADGATPTLLGWSTDADFPVDVAQRQVDRGWGAYEMFNDDGRLTSVFIPAGGSTAVTAPIALHPVLG